MLLTPEIVLFYTRALGNLHRENYRASDFLMLYACACDKLQWCVGEKLLEADPMCGDSYPLMKQLQNFLDNKC